MSEAQSPDWIDALSEALPSTDRRAIEGWAVWFRTLWGDSDRALELLREAGRSGGLNDGPAALLRHLELMGRHIPEVEAHLERLQREIKGDARAQRVLGEVDALAIELKTALRALVGALGDLEVTGTDEVWQQLRDQLDEAIREATELRAKLHGT
jgi:hypothetical protein